MCLTSHTFGLLEAYSYIPPSSKLMFSVGISMKTVSRVVLPVLILNSILHQTVNPNIPFKWMLYPHSQADSGMQVFQFHMLGPKIMPVLFNEQVKKIACEHGLSRAHDHSHARGGGGGGGCMLVCELT